MKPASPLAPISGWSEGVLRYVALDSRDLVEEITQLLL
jgi:hypothetical protein